MSASICVPGAGFSSQAEPLAKIGTLEAYTEWMKGLLGFMPDGRYEVKSFAIDAGAQQCLCLRRVLRRRTPAPAVRCRRPARAPHRLRLRHGFRAREDQSYDQDLECPLGDERAGLGISPHRATIGQTTGIGHDACFDADALLGAAGRQRHAADFPAPQEGDCVAHDFRFHAGEVLPELRLHYTTVGDQPASRCWCCTAPPARRRHADAGLRGRAVRARPAAGRRANITSSCRTRSAPENPPSRRTACARSSRNTTTTTWSRRSTGC